jgi:hypothetical protein
MPTLNIYLFESPIFGMNAIDIFSFRYFFTVFPLVFYVAQLNNSTEYNLEPIHERSPLVDLPSSSLNPVNTNEGMYILNLNHVLLIHKKLNHQ